MNGLTKLRELQVKDADGRSASLPQRGPDSRDYQSENEVSVVTCGAASSLQRSAEMGVLNSFEQTQRGCGSNLSFPRTSTIKGSSCMGASETRESKTDQSGIQSGHSLRSSHALRTELQHEYFMAGLRSDAKVVNPSILRSLLLFFRRGTLSKKSKTISGFRIDPARIDRSEDIRTTNPIMAVWAFFIGVLIHLTWKF